MQDRLPPSYRSSNLPSPSNHPTNPNPKPKQPFVQRTPDEMVFLREKGLCYNCDEKWNASHHCKGRVLLFIVDNHVSKTDYPSPELTTKLEPPIDPKPIPDTKYPHISLHALSGLPLTETFRLFSVISHASLTILIDSDNTHNFLQPRITQFLHLPTQSSLPLCVLVGNNLVLDCNQLCLNTSLSLQGHPLKVTFHLLPISGADAVLGIEWLKQFVPIMTDYTSLIMKFSHMGQSIKLHADVVNGPNPISTPQVKRLIRTGSTSALFHLCLMPEKLLDPPHRLPHLIPAIEALLKQFQHLFQTLTNLPPPRGVVHWINLLPSIAPVNVWPYRYFHFQKTEIEKQISDLISAGLIRPSTSPYRPRFS